MKKTNKKQIPKVRMPKYGDGGASVVSEKRTQNMYGNEPGTGASTGQKTAIAGAALEGGMQAYQTSQTPGLSTYDKNQQYGKSIENTEQGVVSAINPIFGMIHKGTSMIMNPLTAKATKTDAEGNLVNRKQAKNQAIGRAFADPMAMIPTMISTGFNRDKYANEIESSAKAKIAEQKAQEDAYTQQQNAAQEQQNAYIQNAVQQGIAANNQGSGNSTLQYNKYGGQIKFAMGGMQYANGGTGQINSEVEGGGYNQDGENAVAPNGEFTQFNGPTHAQGGIQTDMAPGTRIFSAKLNPVGSKKSFAKLNESNNTNREDKLEAKGNLDPKSKTSIDLTRMAKMKNSDMLFAMQEQLKKDKVAAYAKKMGVQLPYMDNESMEQGQSEQSEGEYKYGGIHINPANKGKFTASAQRAGMGTQEFASHVLANKEDYSSTQVKRANFAHNAAGWKHEMGGMQPYAMGGESEYGGPNDPKPFNVKDPIVKAAIARNLTENPLVRDYSYELKTGGKKGDELFATDSSGKKTKINFQDLNTGEYNPAYNDTVRAAIKIKIKDSLQKHALGGVQLPYYNTDRNGNPKYAMGGFNDGDSLTSVNTSTITNAKKVDTIPANYAKIGTQGSRTYYDLPSDKAKVNPAGGKVSSDWENSIIKRLEGGTSAKSLADAGHISPSQIDKYNKYYKPLYTEIQPINTFTQPSTTLPINQKIALKDENRIDRKSVFTGAPYNTFQYPDVNAGYSKATTRYFDPKTNQEIDASKSFDPKGNYVPSYLNNPAGGVEGTLKETRYNTPIGSTTDNPVLKSGTKDAGTTGFKYGGKMPKYANGAKVPKSLRFVPSMAQEGEDDNTIVPGNNGRTNNYNPDEIMAPDPYKTFDKPDLDKWDAMRLNQSALKAGSSTPDAPPMNNIDWSKTDKFGNLFNFIGQNAGNIYDLTRKNEPLQKYERAKASYLDNTAAMRDAEQEARRDEYAVRGASGGNAGTYLANRVGLNTAKVMNKDRIRQQYANANAQIGNQNAQFNTEIAYREAEARAKDAAMKENVRSQAGHNFAENFGKLSLSNKEDLSDENKLDLYNQYYNTPEFKAFMKKTTWGSKKSTKKSGK